MLASETPQASSRGSGRAISASGLGGFYRRTYREVDIPPSELEFGLLHLLAFNMILHRVLGVRIMRAGSRASIGARVARRMKHDQTSRFAFLQLLASETQNASTRGSERADCASGLGDVYRRPARARVSARSELGIGLLQLLASETQHASTRGSACAIRASGIGGVCLRTASAADIISSELELWLLYAPVSGFWSCALCERARARRSAHGPRDGFNPQTSRFVFVAVARIRDPTCVCARF
ncbi:hypothetical protein N9L68_03680 [bacterium]|nr:hypothetical protein [bacterium]